jgi:ribonuclease P protein component
MVDQRFPKSCRLLDSKAFEQVFGKPDFRVSNKYFLILGCWTDKDGPRLGIIVAKKNIARATQRNSVKRIIREAFRARRSVLGPADLIVLARKDLQFLENSDCQSYIHALIDEIEKKKPSA